MLALICVLVALVIAQGVVLIAFWVGAKEKDDYIVQLEHFIVESIKSTN